MILVTHAVVGGALGSFAGENPALSFILGFLSHFVLDSIPHWDYRLKSARPDPNGNQLNNDMAIGKDFIIDCIKMGFDLSFGIILALMFFRSGNSFVNAPVLFGVLGGVFPDFLQFAYYKLRIPPLRAIQRFHMSISAKKSLNSRPFLGASIQVGIIIIIGILSLLR